MHVDEASKPATKKKRRRGRIVLIVLVSLMVIPVLLRAFVFEAFKTPAASMAPTILVGDHLFVSKVGYTPRRGDVVVFIYPRDTSKDFLKRIVALPGDTLSMREQQIYLNGKPIPRKRLSKPCAYEDVDERGGVKTRSCTLYEEQLDGLRYHVIRDRGENLAMPQAPVKVPPGHVFVLGDNRDNSHDSRAYGAIPVANIKGKAWVIWHSSGPKGTRGGRFWKKVHADI